MSGGPPPEQSEAWKGLPQEIREGIMAQARESARKELESLKGKKGKGGKDYGKGSKSAWTRPEAKGKDASGQPGGGSPGKGGRGRPDGHRSRT